MSVVLKILAVFSVLDVTAVFMVLRFGSRFSREEENIKK